MRGMEFTTAAIPPLVVQGSPNRRVLPIWVNSDGLIAFKTFSLHPQLRTRLRTFASRWATSGHYALSSRRNRRQRSRVPQNSRPQFTSGAERPLSWRQREWQFRILSLRGQVTNQDSDAVRSESLDGLLAPMRSQLRYTAKTRPRAFARVLPALVRARISSRSNAVRPGP